MGRHFLYTYWGVGLHVIHPECGDAVGHDGVRKERQAGRRLLGVRVRVGVGRQVGACTARTEAYRAHAMRMPRVHAPAPRAVRRWHAARGSEQ